ncbi:hypothetical protein BRX43_19360 [Sphingomonas sp. S-NIH.Pt15_0812]|nr:hypothetical protein BRX43_19360 [Sphingomonas sp. S-NIH.Pt15_0812]
MSRPPLTSRDWFGKVSAAAILGFPLTLALTCTFATLCATDDDVFRAQRQLAMRLMSVTQARSGAATSNWRSSVSSTARDGLPPWLPGRRL